MTLDSANPTPVCTAAIIRLTHEDAAICCVLANRSSARLPRLLSPYLSVGDQITFALPCAASVCAEILVNKGRSTATAPCFYLAPISYAREPRCDQRGQQCVSAEIVGGALGIRSVHMPCAALRDYFYQLSGQGSVSEAAGFYELLGVGAKAQPAEMRVAYKLRRMEIEQAGGTGHELAALERAFNILAQPELRACYDALLFDREAPAVFPYGGFGSLLVSGECSRDGHSFFARRISAFRPDSRERRFHLPLRKCDFYQDQALCRDVVRRLEFWIDSALVPLVWDAGWNRWKHLMGVKIEVEGTFVESGRYRKRRGEWELTRWQTGLPSRLCARLPADAAEQIACTHQSFQRFGQYSRAFDQVRLLLEHRAVEKTQLERICAGLKIPGDFDITQISWRPDYDAFFYSQLSQRARRVYLFRAEYIFDLEKAVIVETPRLGHATYVFAKPRNMESFLHLYTRISKEDIRRNRDNAGERLGFVKRVIHGNSARAWLKELRQYLGEKIDFASRVSE